MTQAPNDSARDRKPNPYTVVSLLINATESWATTLRLCVILVLVSAVAAALGTGVSVGLAHIFDKHSDLLWTAITVVVNVTILASFGALRQSLSNIARREEAVEAKRVAAGATFLESMQGLETAGTRAVSNELGELPDVIPLGLTLRVLADQGIWSEQDVSRFRQLMRIRNALVHEERPIDLAVLQSSVEESLRLMRQLSKAGNGDSDRTASR